MLGAVQAGILGSGISAYRTEGRQFDGTNDYATRTAANLGIADGKTGLLNLWFRKDAANDSVFSLIANYTGSTTQRFGIGSINANDTIAMTCRNTSGTVILQFIPATNSVVQSATWYHVLASWDLANAKAHFYLNGVSISPSVGPTNDTIDYAYQTWSVGAYSGGNSKFFGCLSEVWFNTEYLDISIEANRRKFSSIINKPVLLGASGELPTTHQPIIYMPYGNPADNRGTGGNFTIIGSLDVSSTSPSD